MRHEPVYGPISAEQQGRMDESDRALERRRAAACFEAIQANRRPSEEFGEVNCGRCNHLSDFNDEHRRGFCMHLRLSRSTWHPVRCLAFVPLKRDRTIKVAWKGVVYG